MQSFERGIFRQQMTEMIEQAVGLSLSGRLRKLAVVAPCSEIRSRYIWHYAGTFLGDEKAAGSRQEIRMVAIPPIEKVYDAMVNRDLSKQNGCCFNLTFIR